MSVEPAREHAVLQRLHAWDGLSRLHAILDDLKARPNFFLIAPHVLRVEGVHSDMLAWLLDPRGWHGLDDRFARAFVRAVLEDCGLEPRLPLGVDEVHREFSTGRGPVDILLRVRHGDARLVLGVENKIDSPESNDQLDRYAKALAACFPGETVALAFLTPDGREPHALPKCPCASVPYRTVARLLDEAVAAPPAASNHATGLELARHYVTALRTHIMPESNPDIDAICRKLYDEHQEAWRLIRRRLPSERDEFHASIGTKVCERLADNHHGKWLFSVRRDKYACVFRPAWFALGTYDADPIIGLTQPGVSDSKYPRVHFRLVADSSDTDAGEEFRYEVRLKVDTRNNRVLGKSVVAALKAVEPLRSRIPKRDQFTVKLKSTSTLPAVGDHPDSVPDSVVEWYARHLGPLVRVLDSIFRKG